MALLGESEIWPVNKARELHSKAQLSHTWRFMINDVVGGIDGTLYMLAKSLSLPGIEMNHITYNVGTMEKYFQTTAKRGGVVTANFLEIEGGYVDGFFRTWMGLLNPLDPRRIAYGIRSVAGSIGGGFGKTAFGFAPTVELLKRDGSVSMSFILFNLRPKKLGTATTLTYENKSVLTIPVEMVCDEVRRIR
jgi:hypothetical protein